VKQASETADFTYGCCLYCSNKRQSNNE